MSLLRIDDDTVINPNRVVYAYQTRYEDTGWKGWRTTIVFMNELRLTVTTPLADLLKKIELWERGMDD